MEALQNALLTPLPHPLAQSDHGVVLISWIELLSLSLHPARTLSGFEWVYSSSHPTACRVRLRKSIPATGCIYRQREGSSYPSVRNNIVAITETMAPVPDRWRLPPVLQYMGSYHELWGVSSIRMMSFRLPKHITNVSKVFNRPHTTRVAI